MSAPNADIAPSEDPLADTLDQLDLTGTLYCQTDLRAPWGIAIPAFEDLTIIFIVLEGTAVLEVAGEAPRSLKAGDMALVPSGAPHHLLSQTGTPAIALEDLEVTALSPRFETLTLGETGPRTRITCGVVRFDQLLGERLMAHLPPCIVADRSGDPDPWIEPTLSLIAREAQTLGPGSETLITRLTDVLVIQLIRAWLNSQDTQETGWLTALRDRHLGRALSALHKAPQDDWTLEDLAHLAGLSRSAFAARFTQVMGESAISYLTHWRLRLARRALCETQQPMIEIAETAGYGSEAAFSRAFKRLFGHAPGTLRAR